MYVYLCTYVCNLKCIRHKDASFNTKTTVDFILPKITCGSYVYDVN